MSSESESVKGILTILPFAMNVNEYVTSDAKQCGNSENAMEKTHCRLAVNRDREKQLKKRALNSSALDCAPHFYVSSESSECQRTRDKGNFHKHKKAIAKRIGEKKSKVFQWHRHVHNAVETFYFSVYIHTQRERKTIKKLRCSLYINWRQPMHRLTICTSLYTHRTWKARKKVEHTTR